MISNDTLEYMAGAYKVFFVIENSLKETVKKELNSREGFKQQYEFREKLNFDYAHYYQIVSLFTKYPLLQGYFTVKERQKLMKLSSVRNQIAHMNVLTSEEFDFLIECYDLISERLQVSTTVSSISR